MYIYFMDVYIVRSYVNIEESVLQMQSAHVKQSSLALSLFRSSIFAEFLECQTKFHGNVNANARPDLK